MVDALTAVGISGALADAFAAFAPGAAATGDVFGEFKQWVLDSYSRAPAVVLGLAALVALPPLAIIGAALGWGFSKRRQPEGAGERTVAIRRERPALNGKSAPLEPLKTSAPVWPTESWIETVGENAQKYRIGATVVRIGREADNEICLPQKTVHRYHAAVHKSSDAEVLITDLSSKDGNGVLVNGRRVHEAKLKSGDKIKLGEAVLVYVAKPR